MDADRVERKVSFLEYKVKKLVDEYNPIPGSSFNHLTGNILFSLRGRANMMQKQPGNENKGFLKIFLEDYKTLRNYLDFLEKNSEYRDGEMNSEKGYLGLKGVSPEMIEKLHSQPREYVKKSLEFLL